MQQNILFLVAPLLNKILTSIFLIIMKERESANDVETEQLVKTITTFLFALNNLNRVFVVFFYIFFLLFNN